MAIDGTGARDSKILRMSDRALTKRVRKQIIADPQAERAVLGSILIAPDALGEVVDIDLRPEDFYEPKHETIYRAMLGVSTAGKVLDIVMLDTHLSDERVLDHELYHYVHTLPNNVPTSLNAKQYGRTVLEKALERETQAIGAEITTLEMSPQEAMARLQVVEERRLLLTTRGDGLPGMVLADIERQDVRWLWRGRLARGKLAIIDGDPGQGKGFMTLDIAARITKGRPMPDSNERTKPASVILMTPEDDASDTIRPRLEAAEADLRRIRMLTTTTETDPATGQPRERFLTIPRDILLIETAVQADRAALVIIDPIMACLDAGVKTNSDSEVRAALMPLKAMAERTGCVVLLVRHFNKGGGDNALYRGGGSIAFTGLCRTTFLVAAHPDGGEKRVMASAKSNIGRLAPSLAFSLVSDPPDAMPYVGWDREPCEYDARELLTARKSDERRGMVELFKEQGKPLGAQDVADLLDITLNAAKVRLHRMHKAGEIISPSKGLYTLIAPVTNVMSVITSNPVTSVTTSHDDVVTGGLGDVTRPVTTLSLGAMRDGGYKVTEVTGLQGSEGEKTPSRSCLKCGNPLSMRPGGGWYPCTTCANGA